MSKKKILIIDDEEDICAFSKSILEKTGKFEAVFATQASEGIGLAKSYKPDLILLDLLMPYMDGSKAAEILSEDPSTKDIPVVFLTALAKTSEVEKGSGLISGRFFLPKTLSSQELVERIESILKQLNRL